MQRSDDSVNSRKRELERRNASSQDREFRMMERERELDKRDHDNEGMCHTLIESLDQQKGRDARAQDEIQNGFLVLQQRFREVEEKERRLTTLKKQIYEQSLTQQRVVHDLQSTKDELSRAQVDVDSRGRMANEIMGARKRDVDKLEDALQRKQMEIRAMSQKEATVHQLLARLKDREQDFENQIGQLDERLRKAQRDREDQERELLQAQREDELISQDLSAYQRSRDAREKENLSAKLHAFKIEEQLHLKMRQLEELQTQLDLKRAHSLSASHSSHPVANPPFGMYSRF